MLNQLFSAIRRPINWLASAVSRGITTINNGFKSLFVNSMSIDTFLVIAKYLPIGGWLVHEKPDEFGTNSVHTAIREKNKEKLRTILRTASASEEAVHKYLLSENVINQSPISRALIVSRNQPGYLKILLEAVRPEKRLWLIQQVKHLGDDFVFSLVLKNSKTIENVMLTLPGQDRFKLMNNLDRDGDTPAMVQLSSAASYSEMRAFMKHCPQEKAFSYLTKINKKGQTALMCLLAISPKVRVDDSFAYVLNLIPKERRKAFLASHHQGEKLMLLADADGRTGVKALLRKEGIEMPKLETSAKRSSKQLFEEWEAKEKFKEMHGVYPLVALSLEDKVCPEKEIKRAYHLKMFKYHPDRNKKENAKNKTQRTIAAYEFYSKPATRKKYLGR
ncbi:J domain-containing protein [Candidatus Berkiella aquae]|uniref:Chaperone protein DnaJ n=1 Tax=Candidatus Berkiella aquae TaxID=295108 RepID=A0A0Q9YW72_9GAMM|nr:DnaJ domain-containing protein [Candidatus Berkiella aquae]MCS5710537.1 DnaJ domain-containing protein [Candidatus Berkiella aquae]